jgi:hypothetical protein
MNHSFNGGFHCLLYQPEGINERGQNFEESIITSHLQFSIVSLQNTIFGNLIFNLQSRDHNHLADQNDNISKTVKILHLALRSGAIGGYSKDRLKELFCRFNLTFVSSRGGQLANPQANNEGLVFFRWSVGPFSLDDVLVENDDQLNDLVATIEETLRSRMEVDDTFGVSDHVDNSDILDYNEVLTEFGQTRELDFKSYIFKRRMDEVIVKFFPRYIQSPSPAIIRPINYRSQLLPVNPQLRIPIDEAGDGVTGRLMRIYRGGAGEPFEAYATSLVSDPHHRNFVQDVGMQTTRRLISDLDTLIDEDIEDSNLDRISERPGDVSQWELLPLNRANADIIPHSAPFLPNQPELVSAEPLYALNNREDDQREGEESSEEEVRPRPGYFRDGRPFPAKEPRFPPTAAQAINQVIETIEDIGESAFERQLREEAEERERLTARQMQEAEVEEALQEELVNMDFDDVYEYDPVWGLSRRAGCIIDDKDRLEEAILRLGHVIEPKDDGHDYNCFLRCLLISKAQEYTDESLNLLRRLCHIPNAYHITLHNLQAFANYFGDIYHIWNIIQVSDHEKLVAMREDPNAAKISHVFREIKVVEGVNEEVEKKHKQVHHFLWYKDHCYLITDPKWVVHKVKCHICTQWINKSNFGNHAQTCHYCIVCRRSYSTVRKPTHICKGPRLTPHEARSHAQQAAEPLICADWINLPRIDKPKKMTDPKKIWLADIEAFPNIEDQNCFTPYAIGIINLEKGSKHKIFYGQDCMGDFLDFCDTITGSIYFFNGARFDNYLVVKGMVKEKRFIDSENFLKNGGSIISFKIHRHLKVKDLCQFIKSSLEKACKDWGVPASLSKKTFDHDKVWNMETAMQHKAECEVYLKYDIVSLRELYRIYSTAQFECFGIDVNRAISLSQYGFKCWGSNCKAIDEIYVPHTGKEEDDFRAAYYGGRTLAQRKEFKSAQFDAQVGFPEYNEIEDYLVIADVNSLYPHAQRKYAYAYGKWRYVSPEEIREANLIECLNSGKVEYQITFLRCQLKVSVKCPKDLITAFLLERTPKGKLVHTLEDKIEQWYWGCELIEAVILGYEITEIHEVIEFEKIGELFNDFVDKCWQGRIDNPKPSVKNLAFKEIMNCLTGKFGQKSHQTNTSIFTTSYQLNAQRQKIFETLLENVVDFDPIFDQTGANHAIIIETKASSPHPAYPIYLSGQILAYSRVYMSSVYRACNAYRDPTCAIFYTDTDSMVLPSKCVPPLVELGFIGSGLGQLGCDLHDPFVNNLFSKIIRGVWAAPKGPYSLIYVNPNENLAREKIRTKGIPHPKGPFVYLEGNDIDLSVNSLDKMIRAMNWLESPHKFQVPSDFVKERFYLFKRLSDGETHFARYLNFDIIQKMMNHEGELTCFFGGMSKDILTRTNAFLCVAPTINKRAPCRLDWWTGGNRFYAHDLDPTQPRASNFDLTYPKGYELRGEM